MAEEIRYRDINLYNGNAAYEVVWQEEESREERPARKPAKHRRQHRAYGVSVTAVLGVLLTAVMIVFTLMSYAAYTETAAEALVSRERVETLSDENRKLTAAYEAAFDMNEVKAYAQSELGMSEPTSSQVGYAKLEAQDSVAVYSSSGREESVLSGITAMIVSAIGGK